MKKDYDFENIIIPGIQHGQSLENYHRVNPNGDNDIKIYSRKGAKSNLHNHSTQERINHRKESKLKAKIRNNLFEQNFRF